MDEQPCEIEKHLQNLLIEDLFSPKEPPNREQIVVDLSSYKVIPFENDSDTNTDVTNVEPVDKPHENIDKQIFNANDSTNIPMEAPFVIGKDALFDIENSILPIKEEMYSKQDDIIKKKKDDIILIVSLGRSGSTTLVNILNTIPNTNICGENYNAVLKLLTCYYELKQVKLEIPTSGNYNTFSLIKSREIIKGLIISLFKNNAETNLWGFKEIRWYEDLRMLSVFRELFPEVKIIYNTRVDIERQSKSAFWGEINDSLNLIEKRSSDVLALLIKEKFNFLNITLEDFYDRDKMKGLFDFIERPESFNEAVIKQILDQTKKIYGRGPYLHLHTFYSAKYKFVHVPKTGGSAIERFIKPYSNSIIGFGHDNTCKENNNPVIVIRYPADRFISMYYYWKYGSEIYKRDAVWQKKYKSFTIKDFITLIDQNSTSNLYSGFTWDQHFAPYSDWIDETSYSKTVVILYEPDLTLKIRDLIQFINPPRIEKDSVVQKINVSRKGEWCELDAEDLEWVKEKYKDDFILWNNLHQQPELFAKII